MRLRLSAGVHAGARLWFIPALCSTSVALLRRLLQVFLHSTIIVPSPSFLLQRYKSRTRSPDEIATESENTPPGATSIASAALVPMTSPVGSFQLEAARVRAASRLAAETSIARRSGSRETRRYEDTVDSDTFLDDWDMTIRRCPACHRPFGTPERLAKHQEKWTNGSCRAAAPRYEHPSQDQKGTPIEDLVPGADLIVNIDDGQSKDRFRVPSQVLAAASNCFQVSFGPTAQFRSANDVRRAAIRGSFGAEIDLDDNPAAMKLVLKILCFRYPELPATVDFRTIVEIAIIADKYEMDVVLRPWATKWWKPHEKVLRLPEGDDERWVFDESIMDWNREYDDWLFISWVFGHEKAFVAISRVLTMMDHDMSQLCKQTPEQVLEKIRELRSSRVRILRGVFEGIRTIRLRENDRPHCRSDSQKKACDAMHLGYFWELIIKFKLDREPAWAENFVGLAMKIREIRNEDVLGHPRCGWITGFQRVAKEAIGKDLHLNLSDFPSRVERMMLRSPLDSVENGRCADCQTSISNPRSRHTRSSRVV